MKRLFSFLLLVSSWSVFAQNAVLRGVVKSADGDQLPYANLLLFTDSVINSADSQGIFYINTYQGKKKMLTTYTVPDNGSIRSGYHN